MKYQDHQVLAALSSKDSITIPSIHSDAIKAAQADDEVISEKAEKKGLCTWTWVAIGVGVVAVAGIALAAGGGGGGDHSTGAPCLSTQPAGRGQTNGSALLW